MQGVCLSSVELYLDYFWSFGCIIFGVDLLKLGIKFEVGINLVLAPFCTCFVGFHVGEREAQMVLCISCRVWYVCNMLLCGWIKNAVFLSSGYWVWLNFFNFFTMLLLFFILNFLIVFMLDFCSKPLLPSTVADNCFT